VSPQKLQLSCAHESWPIAGSFTISRGSKTAADVVVVTLAANGISGRGECTPYPRYGETVDQVLAALEALRNVIEQGIGFEDIRKASLPMAAKNALDCALWDLRAKLTGTSTWRTAGLAGLRPLTTAYTISLGTPEAMAEAAKRAAHRPLLKLKLGQTGDAQRLRAVRRAVPKARLIVDANEGWTAATLPNMLSVCAETGVELLEQPLPANDDEALAHIKRAIPVCADESAHGAGSLPSLIGKYDAVNIKLDKTGGLTPALEFAHAAKAANMKIMVGCMVATSLAMAPAFLVGQLADLVDLDGPLLLKQDREPGLHFEGSNISPPTAELWG
jgi:L-Ala-D/L-Glu epimerase